MLHGARNAPWYDADVALTIPEMIGLVALALAGARLVTWRVDRLDEKNQRSGTTTAAVALAVLTAGCASDPPGAPTTDRPEPAAPTIPADGSNPHPDWFEQDFFKELVYDAAERGVSCPQGCLLERPSTINILLDRREVTGRCGADFGDFIDVAGKSIPYRRIVATETRGLIESATGVPWRGRVESTADKRRADSIRIDRNWITVEFRVGSWLELKRVAQAWVGKRPGLVTFFVSPNCTLSSARSDDFLSTYAHELGHALGFFHVRLPAAVMTGFPNWNTPTHYTLRESRHMQLAYRTLGSGGR